MHQKITWVDGQVDYTWMDTCNEKLMAKYRLYRCLFNTFEIFCGLKFFIMKFWMGEDRWKQLRYLLVMVSY